MAERNPAFSYLQDTSPLCICICAWKVSREMKVCSCFLYRDSFPRRIVWIWRKVRNFKAFSRLLSIKSISYTYHHPLLEQRDITLTSCLHSCLDNPLQKIKCDTSLIYININDFYSTGHWVRVTCIFQIGNS